MKKLISLELYREGVLTLGKACELGGITKWEFFELNKRANIPLQTSEDEWEKDKARAEELLKRPLSATPRF